MDKEIVYRVEDGMDREKILCTTYQMRNFYMQFRDGFFTNLDVMNYIQHLAAAHMAKKGMNVLDVCCGRSLMLPLLRYYAKDIASYTGVDISKANIKEAMRGATAKNLEPKDLASYYPFRVGWKLGNVAEMSKVIPAGFADFVIYTSAIEHMHPTDGAKSLAECYKVMKPGAKMFLSCPNTPGNGYQTQYRAHVYEWGYDELKAKLTEIGFSIVQEVGLVTSVREMDEFYSKQPSALKDFYERMKSYVPSAFLTAFMAIPFPREAKELLFIVQKPKGEENAYVNSCHCTPDEIIEATMIIFDATEVVYSERRDIPATIYLSVSAPFSDLVLAILGTHDLVVHPAGVKVRINCSTEDAETFGFTDLNPRVAGFGKGIFAQSIN